MATLTTSYQLLSQKKLGEVYGSNSAYIRLYAKYNSQSIENNTSNVSIQARLYNESAWYASSGTYYRITGSGSIDSGNVSCLTSSSNMWAKGEVILGTQTKDINHNSDGSRAIHAEAQFVSSPWGWNVTASDTNIGLPSIPRQANIKTAPDFNDEENPTITYENPAGNSVTSLQACISLSGSADDISYRDINKTGTLSYTFKLTEEERNILRKNTASNSRKLFFFVKTVIGSNTYDSKLEKTFTIINAEPVFNDFEFEDINEKTIALTGSNQDVILGYSNVKVTIPVANKAIALKEATMKSYRFNNISVDYSDIEDVNITSEKITSGDFTVYAIDSRSNSTPKIKSAVNVINYTPLSKNTITATRENGVSENVVLNFSGKIDLIDFGAVINSIKTSKYRYTVAGKETWSEYNDLELVIEENGNFNFNDSISGDIENVGFDINNSYNIEVVIEDELSIVTYSATLGSGIPHIAYAKNGVGIMGKYDESVGGLLQVGGKKINNPSILNDKSNSQTDVYSCDYINKLNTYSTEEQVIGTWIDGKPIYKKTFVGRYESGSVLIENVGVLVDVEGQADSGGNKRLIPYYELYGGAVYEAKLQIDTQNRLVTATQVNSTSTAYNWAVTVKYTKTTD